MFRFQFHSPRNYQRKSEEAELAEIANVECLWILHPFEEQTKAYERPTQ
jgi:hypothetical protein